MTTVIVEPLDYVEAADQFRAVSTNALNHFSSATSTLRGYANMAGDDNGGQDFADAYDGSAQVMLQALYDIAVAASSFDRGIMSTGKMHHQAEQFAAGLPADDGAFVIRNLVPEMSVAGPPSAYGGPANPGPIDVVRDLFALIWPNADTPMLKNAARAWADIGGDFSALATAVRQATSPLNSSLSVEVGHIDTKAEELARGIDELAASAGDIGDVCEGYAQDVDDAHNEVIPMVVQLVAEIALGAGISFALSFVTFGAAGAVGAAAIAIRVASVAARVGSILARVLATAGRVAMRLRQIAIALKKVAERFHRLFALGREIVSGTAAGMIVEGVSQGENANYLAAAAGGLIGGGVTGGITAALAARTASLMGRIGVGTLAGGVGGGIGGAGDSIVRTGTFDAKAIVFGTVLGSAGGGIGGGVSKPNTGGPGGSTPDGGAPKIDSSNVPDGSTLDASTTAPDGKVPANTGGDSTPGGNSTRPPVDADPFTPRVDADPAPPPMNGGPSTPRAPIDADPFTPRVDADPAPPPMDGDPTPASPDSTPPTPENTPATSVETSTTTTPDTTSTPDGTTTTPDTTSTPDGTTTTEIAHAGDNGDSTYSTNDSVHMTGGEGARIELHQNPDGTTSQRLDSDPTTYGDASHQTPDPQPVSPEVLARPDVQALLNGDPPVLVNDNGVLRVADDLSFTFDRNQPHHTMPEFLRQGRLQEDGLNRLTIQDIIRNQNDYDARADLSPTNNGRTGASEQAAYADSIKGTYDPSTFDSRPHVLHGPDQRAGGNPFDFDGVGDGGVNQSLGSQWATSTKADDLYDAMRRVLNDLPTDLGQMVYPNITIRIVDTLSIAG